MDQGYHIDVTVAKLLACLPAFEAWSDTPLDPGLQEILNEADQQTMMTVAAYALGRIAQDTPQNAHSNSK